MVCQTQFKMSDAFLFLSLFIILQVFLLGCIFYLWSSQHFSSDGDSPNFVPSVFYYRASESMGSDTEYAIIRSQNHMANIRSTEWESNASTSGLSSSRVLSAIDSEPV